MSWWGSAIARYVPRRLSPAVKELYWSTVIMNFSLSMALIFEPVYLYQKGVPLPHIMLFYMAVYGLYFFLIPLGARFANKFGYEHSMFYASFFQIAYYVVLLLNPTGWYLFLLAPLMYALQKSLYWPAYHANFAQYSDPTEEGREVGAVTATAALMYVIGPIFGGLVASQFGFFGLFTVISVLMIISNWPMLRTKEIFKPGGFSWAGAYSRLFSKINRRVLFGVMGYGEELLVLTVWPIFIYAVVKSDLSALGALVTFAALATTVITLVIGGQTDVSRDREARKRLLRFGAISYVGAWIARLFVSVPIHIFGVETWSRVSKDALSVPLIAINYDQAKELGSLERVTLFEMALVIGKILAAGLAALLFFLFPGSWSAVFALGALFSLMYLIF
ncbi:MAG: MFS transporter [bacterium]